MNQIISRLLEVSLNILASKDCKHLDRFDNLTLNAINDLRLIIENIYNLRNQKIRELFHTQLFTANGISMQTWNHWQKQFPTFDFSQLKVHFTEDNRFILRSY